MSKPKLVPELYSADFARSRDFYVRVLGFSVRYDRPEDRFAYLEREGAELMIEQTRDPARLFLAGPLEAPFGRGLHLQIEVSDVVGLYTNAHAAGARLLLDLEDRWYRRGDEEVGNRQFVVTDPDGYVLRFFEDLGARPSQTA
jgi:catechol 2,3-dioxygenase-like lactoylglutathione lyase family enzyme